MVRALLEGRKTQTRRVVNPQPFVDEKWGLTWEPRGHAPNKPSYVERNANWNPISNAMMNFGCPYGQPGDRLWVKETFARVHPGMLQSLDPDPDSFEWTTVYRADANGGYVGKLMECTKWKPSIFMRREYSRITLEIKSVRVERLQEISEGDAMAEGCDEAHLEHTEDCKSEHCALAGGVDDCCGYLVSSKLQYKALWTSINGPGSWDANPWVWVITFRNVQP